MALAIDDLKLVSSGKVREAYEYGDDLLLVASDRISIYDVILPDEIPQKGVVLTSMSNFWFDRTWSIQDWFCHRFNRDRRCGLSLLNRCWQNGW